MTESVTQVADKFMDDLIHISLSAAEHLREKGWIDTGLPSQYPHDMVTLLNAVEYVSKDRQDCEKVLAIIFSQRAHVAAKNKKLKSTGYIYNILTEEISKAELANLFGSQWEQILGVIHAYHNSSHRTKFAACENVPRQNQRLSHLSESLGRHSSYLRIHQSLGRDLGAGGFVPSYPENLFSSSDFTDTEFFQECSAYDAALNAAVALLLKDFLHENVSTTHQYDRLVEPWEAVMGTAFTR